MKNKCECGSDRIEKLTLGGQRVKFNFREKMTLFRWDGFEPDIYGCLACGKIQLFIPDRDLLDANRRRSP